MAVAQMNSRMPMQAQGKAHTGWLLGFDLLGLQAGWRAYRRFEALASLSDGQLAAKGLTRDDLPQAALSELKRAL